MQENSITTQNYEINVTHAITKKMLKKNKYMYFSCC